MPDISIANLPAFLGTSMAPNNLGIFVDVADTTESPLGTTKRFAFQQFANFGGPLTITGDFTAGGSISAGPKLVLNAPPVTPIQVLLETNNLLRWSFGSDGTAETGGNAGNNLVLAPASDAGMLLAPVLTVGRAAGGIVTLGRGLHVQGALTIDASFSTQGLVVSGAPTDIAAINATGAVVNIAAGAFVELAQNLAGYGLIYIAGLVNAFNHACLVAYVFHQVDIIWQTGIFTTAGGTAGSINLFDNAGTGLAIQNLSSASPVALHVLNFAS